MFVDIEEFEIKMLRLIAIANNNIKIEETEIKSLKQKQGFYPLGDENNPQQKIPIAENAIKEYKAQIRAYQVAIDTAKRIA